MKGMNRSASERHCLTPAPGGLALVQELLNTAPAEHPGCPDAPDLLADGALGVAQDWVDQAVRHWAGRRAGPTCSSC
ncbi:CGNR zinc finger domain-containing protein OS=Streptomyces alboniger OX=132473 GN=CP975_18575 PE=4 SV=1 [Streptomyces alboniger]